MGNIIRIFKRDLKSICTHFFPLLICLALVVIGSCYAIFNIYSNWDPYANTDNLTILVYNNDKGYTAEDGTYSNQGETIVEELKENKSIHWVEADSKNALIESVTNGYVYAGIVIDEEFSYDMFNFLSASDGFAKPKIQYYDNDKKNAIAIKVTDTAVETLQSTINKTFLATVVKTVFEEANTLVTDTSEKNTTDIIVEKLTAINENLMEYNDIITTFTEGTGNLHDKLAAADSQLGIIDNSVNNGLNDIEDIQSGLADTKASYNEFSVEMNTLLTDMSNSLSTITTDVENSKLLTGDIDSLNNSINKTLQDVSGLYKTAVDVDNNYDSETIRNFLVGINALSSSLQTIQTVNISAPDLSSLETALNNCSDQVKSLQDTYTNAVTPEINGVIDNMSVVLDNITSTLQTLSTMTGNVSTLFENIDTTVSYTDESLLQVQEVIQGISTKLTKVLEEVNAASEDEKLQILVDFLSGDAESYSKYFSEIIQVDTTIAYPVDNYGSACSVFYITLALYVLALLLTSELKVDADIKGLKNLKTYETYFGRYLTFWLLGFIQSLFLSAFCIYILKIQCEHVLAFFVVNAFISLVFTNITYSCVKTFGMVYGRTLATILVIFQMSTGGCTYSVEQIPSSMRWMSPYMPFTYCSNALREVCFGYSGYDLSIYLMKLSLFIVVALFVGIIVREPLVNLMKFIDMRMAETGLMGSEESEEEEENTVYDENYDIEVEYVGTEKKKEEDNE